MEKIQKRELFTFYCLRAPHYCTFNVVSCKANSLTVLHSLSRWYIELLVVTLKWLKGCILYQNLEHGQDNSVCRIKLMMKLKHATFVMWERKAFSVLVRIWNQDLCHSKVQTSVSFLSGRFSYIWKWYVWQQKILSLWSFFA